MAWQSHLNILRDTETLIEQIQIVISKLAGTRFDMELAVSTWFQKGPTLTGVLNILAKLHTGFETLDHLANLQTLRTFLEG